MLNLFALKLNCEFQIQMRAAVREVASYFPTAIISGRSRNKVKHSLN